jgi:hypothetical protein
MFGFTPVATGLSGEEVMKQIGIDIEAARKDGVDIVALAKIFEDPQGACRSLVKDLFPDTSKRSDPAATMFLFEASQKIHAWRDANIQCLVMAYSGLKKSADGFAAYAKRARELTGEAKDELLGQAKVIAGLRNDLRLAGERAGVYSSEDKRAREVADEHVKSLKAEKEGIMQTMEGQITVIRSQDAQIAGLKRALREAESHGQTALERLSDRFPVPTPFFGAIMDELRTALKFLTP